MVLGNPVRTYAYKQILSVVGKREINYTNVPNYKNEISKSLGLYKRSSSDFDHILNTFFGFYPWDGFYKDDYIDEVLTPDTQKRSDVKYLKDYNIEELKQIMPANSIKLIEIINERNE